MNKLKQIEALVEEAFIKLGIVTRNTNEKKILIDFGRKCAEIDEEDWEDSSRTWIGDTIKTYNSRLLGDEKKEVKQEQPALQPLPEQMPEWFASYFNGRGNDAVSCYIHCKYTFGTPTREWWKDLKKGDKFIYDYTPFNYKEIREFSELLYVEESKNYLIIDSKDVFFRIQFCSPYTDPEAELRKTLNPDQIKLLDEMKANTKV